MRSQAARPLLAALVLLLLGFAAGYFSRVPVERGVSRIRQGVETALRQRYLGTRYVGRPAADIVSVRLDGTPFRLSESKGKVVLLFFWASWCPYSRRALPGIDAIQDRYADRVDFEIVGVPLDYAAQTFRDAMPTLNISWANINDRGSALTYDVRSVPSLWVIGKDSTVYGAEMALADAEDLLSVLLENKHRDRPLKAATMPASLEATGGGACPAAQ